MGIKQFSRFLRNNFPEFIHDVLPNTVLADLNLDIEVDNFMIDMNGLFHNCAQKVYKYGNHKPPERLLNRPQRRVHPKALQRRFFENVCQMIEHLLDVVNPKKRLILCVDGPAPLAKQGQQRQRRFRSAAESGDTPPFETSSLTPGTQLMDYLTKYVDWYIRKQLSESEKWKKLDIIFSNEKVPSEGEQKCNARGTEILLWNGSIKKVEDIQVGDQLIGDNGLSRTVQSIITGEDEMYEIIQNNAENYTVNKNHILSLQIADHKRTYWSEKEGAWIVSYYDYSTNRCKRKQFSGLRDGEKTFTKMTDEDRTCTDCCMTYTTRENYNKHMKKNHGVDNPKMKTYGRATSKTKSDAYASAMEFLATIPEEDVLDISVNDYLKLPKNTQRRLYGFRCSGVYWPEQKVGIDPYLLGIWLGDGTASQPQITTVDKEIIDYLQKYCDDNGYRLSQGKRSLTARNDYHYRICDPNPSKSPPSRSAPRNRLMQQFRKYNLLNNKHIPKDYLVNDETTRLKVLAGIIDSDGNVTQEGRLVRITQCIKHKQLVEDIIHLARSLGFCVNERAGVSSFTYKDQKIEKECFIITISGDLHKMPTLIARKKCLPPPVPGENGRSILVDKLRTSIEIKSVGRDQYYGFNTDGNHRFLLHDFTVTHNCVKYIRQYGSPDETYCINGLDADLVMLALGTQMPKFYLLREDVFHYNIEFQCINIGGMRNKLTKMLCWEDPEITSPSFNSEQAINDFILIGFMVGNDFLPHVPSIEIIHDGLELMIDVYRKIGASYGHLTEYKDKRLLFVPGTLKVFLSQLGAFEKINFEQKLEKKESYFQDITLESCAKQQDEGKWDVDIAKYNECYHKTHFPEANIEDVCHSYLEGLQWILGYYTRGVPNWRWYFPYHYAPSASMIKQFTDTFIFPNYGRTIPTLPFQQLLCVLPPKCANLIPSPLDQLLINVDSPLKKYCPDKLEIDLSGKRQEWEGVVLLPMVDFEEMCTLYKKYIDKVDARDRKRNIVGRSYVYKHDQTNMKVFSSYYGDIHNCTVRNQVIEL